MTSDEDLDLIHRMRLAVEDQGGAQIEGACESRPIAYTKPKQAIARTSGCGHSSLYVNVYDLTQDAIKKKAIKRGGGFITSCLFCDGMALWPRFAAEVR